MIRLSDAYEYGHHLLSRMNSTGHNGFMYFKDLSPYCYLGREPDPNLLTVGWIDAEHEFQKGAVSDHILSRILSLCFSAVNQTRGFHQSPFFKSTTMGYSIEYKGKQMELGSAAIRD